MERVLVGVQGNSSRSPSSTLPPSLHEYPGSMPDSELLQAMISLARDKEAGHSVFA
jgi:hypothetical protein